MELSTQFSVIPTEPAKWLAYITQHYTHINETDLSRTLTFATSLVTRAASPYSLDTLSQGIRMATLLLDLNCDTTTLGASLLYPGYFYAQPDKTELEENVPTNIITLLQGAGRMEAIHTLQREGTVENPQQIDNLRKMLLAIVDDIRIVLIKLVERLITLEFLKESHFTQRETIAQQVLDFYAPLANRLGIGQLKWQLEDLAFRYLNPEDYSHISKSLNMKRREREAFITEMTNTLKDMVESADIHGYSISGRAKHIYSIYKKAKRKQVPIEEIYDASALRVLVDSVQDCYTLLSLVHDRWPHVDAEFDDYIAQPKGNGYKSIHTAIITPDKLIAEIQIRTYDMHQSAELGVAAHWRYKEGAKGDAYEDKIERLRELMQWQQEVTEDQDPQLYQSLFNDRVYVFTPQGDAVDLTAGSTPLDFAYHIHTSVGHRTKGAKINGKIVPLTHHLQTGDRVEIITGSQENPSRDWMSTKLGYLNTTQARAKVRNWFKKQNYDSDLHTGLGIWDKAIRGTTLKKQDLSKITKRFNVSKIDDLLVAIGSGNLGINTVISALSAPKPDQTIDKPIIKKPTQQTQPAGLNIEGVGQLMTHLARCCKPIPGDDIIGFITQGRGVSIHHRDCPNIAHQINTNPHRIIEVNWGQAQTNHHYPVDLTITCTERNGLIRDISAVIANEKLNLLALNTQFDANRHLSTFTITVELRGDITIDQLKQKLRCVSDVLDVNRS